MTESPGSGLEEFSRSDDALMDVTPTRAGVVLQLAGDGMVRFFVMSLGVLVW